MADEVLGISGSMDISDIQKSINDLIGHMQKLNLETDSLSKHFNENFQKIQSSSADAATKQKQTMELFASSIEQAKKQMATLPEQIKAASKEALSFSDSCVSIKNKMMDLKIGSDEFAKLNAQLQQNQRAAELATQRHDELANSFNGLTAFIANASASIDAFNGISAAATGSTGLNAVSHGAVTAALAGETAGRAANTEAMGKEIEAMTENSQASQSQVENMEQKKTLTNEYSSALDTLTEKIRNNQQVSEQQIQNEINLAQERIKQLEEEKSKKEELMSAKYSEYEKYSSDAILGDPAKKEENLSKAKEAVDAYNQLASEINNTDNSIRQINASINALNSELYANSNAVKNSQDSLSESINQTKNAAEALNNETNKAADNDPFGVQKMSIETLKAEYEATTQRLSELKKEYDGFINKGGEEKYAEKMAKNASETKELNEKLKAVTAELKKQGVEIDKNTTKTKKQANEVDGLFKQLKGGFGGGIGGIFNTLLSGKFLGWATAIGAVAKGLWDASKAAEEYRKSLMPLKHYMDDMDFKTVRQDIMALTATTSKSASDMAGAATYFVKVWEGFRTSPEALITMVKSANEFAILSGKSSAEAAKAIANLASEYHLTAQQASQMSAMIANAAKNTTSSFDEMASAISSAGSQAALYGVSFKDMTTLIGYSANQFGGASKAASKFNMMLMTMSGLETKFRPSAVGMVKALENLKEAYDRGERPQDKFMKRQRAAAEYFIKNADAIKKYGQAIDNTTEKDKLLADRQTTAEANLNKLKNSWNGLLTSLNVNLTPILNNILQFFNRIIGGAQRTADELAFLKDFRAKNPTKTSAASSGMVTFSNGSNEEAELKAYRRQRDDIKNKFATYFKIAKSKYKYASLDAQINIANNALVSFYKQNQQDYNRISKSIFNSMLPKLRAQARAMEMKPVNSGDIGDGGNNGNDALEEANKKAKQTEELLKMQRKERFDAEKQALAARQAIRDADIAAEKNDSVREIKMLENAHQQRMEQIEQQKKDMLENNIQKAASEYQKKHENDKNYKGFFTQGLDKEVTLTEDQLSQINAQIRKANEERDRSIREYDEKAISSHQSYIDKRIAIDKQYSEEMQKYYALIDNARARGDNDTVTKLQRSLTELQKSYAKSKMTLAFEELKKSPDFSIAFDDLTNTGTKTIETLIKRFQETRGIAGQSLGVEDMKEYISVINRMTDELISRNPAKVIEEQSRKLRDYQLELKNAQNILDSTRKGDKIIKSFKIIDDNGIQKAVPVYWSLADAEENIAIKAQLVSNSQNILQKSFKSIISDINGLIISFNSLGEAIGGSAGGIISAIGSIGNDMTSFMSIVSELPNAKGNFLKTASSYISLAGTVISIGTKISGLFDSISPSYEKAAEKQKEINNLRRAVESYRLAVIRAKNEENSWFDTTGLQSLKNAYIENGEIAKQYYAQLYEAQEKYQNKKAGLSGITPYLTAIGGIALGAVTGGLGALAVGAATGAGLIGSVAAATIIGAAVDGVAGYIIGKGSEAALNAITYKDGQVAAVNNLRVQTQHKTWFRGEKTEDLRDWVKKQYGEELFDEKGLINLEIANAVLDSGAKLVGETRETLEKLIELREEYDKFREQLRDYVSQTYSPIADNMTDAIWDWLKDGENVMDKFKEYASSTFADIAKEMVKQMVLTKVFDGIENQLTGIYEKYARGGIDETGLLNQVSMVIDKLVENYEDNIPTLQNLMSLLDEKFSDLGFDITGNEYEQSATAKAISSVTYDQANALEGRLTAIQICGEQQLTETQIQTKYQERMTATLDSLRLPVQNIDSNIETMVGIQTSMNEHLEKISMNTSVLPGMATNIGKMYKKIENM